MLQPESAENIGDFFTKPLPARIFFPMRDRIMNVPVSERVMVK